VTTARSTGFSTELDAGPRLATRSCEAIGTTASVTVTRPAQATQALSLLGQELDAIDLAASRFRPDAEIAELEATSHGEPVPVSPLLFAALTAALDAAMATAGTVDPTCGAALCALGYDRDFALLAAESQPPSTSHRATSNSDAHGTATGTPVPGWWQLTLDPERRTAAVPTGVHLDLGSTAKALAADRAAVHLASILGCGVLVNLGGDIAIAGEPPAAGWPVGIAAAASADVDDADEVIALYSGALATSGTTARIWQHDGLVVHHIVDPATGRSAEAVWSLVSVIGASCLEANAFATAAVIWGEDAPGHLAERGLAARLVRTSGEVLTVGPWPTTEDSLSSIPS
jgi:thiamine biosynthesis lipoprotein